MNDIKQIGGLNICLSEARAGDWLLVKLDTNKGSRSQSCTNQLIMWLRANLDKPLSGY